MSVDSSWTEPKSDYKPIYPYNNITQTQSGHFFEMDDTPGVERVRLQHRTGTFTEVQADGQRINKVKGDNYEIIIGDNHIYVKGQCNITVEGACVINVKGDAYTVVEGDSISSVNGNSTQTVLGKTEINSTDDVKVNTSGSVDIQATDVNINGDLNVRGGITSTQSISALGNVTAGMNMSAVMSFQTPGYITAGISITTPLGNFVWMKDTVNEALYNSHIHMSPKGPTGGPMPNMI
jgi:hypothetical protein